MFADSVGKCMDKSSDHDARKHKNQAASERRKDDKAKACLKSSAAAQHTDVPHEKLEIANPNNEQKEHISIPRLTRNINDESKYLKTPNVLHPALSRGDSPDRRSDLGFGFGYWAHRFRP